jgi:hypothetical protein
VLNGDDFVSLEHAEIVYTAAGAVLRNRSANGTLVNGRPTTEAVLAPGDKVSIGLLHLLTIKSIPSPAGAERPSSASVAPAKGQAAATPVVRKGRKVPIWLVTYLGVIVVAGIGLAVAKARGASAAGLSQVRIQEEQYAATREWPPADTTRVLRLLETAVVHERRGDARSAYEVYREALGVRRPVDPRSPAYRYAASKMAALGPREPRRR